VRICAVICAVIISLIMYISTSLIGDQSDLVVVVVVVVVVRIIPGTIFLLCNLEGFKGG